ncbi:MAG: branched-chain amino acid ABC transporter permease [Thermoanaerobacterales bacterium]|nr:branched-chain amino acid ABC transporter permease [Bacillota bacterium]MDI6906336.1 branched-chain amino acid ABC transporter permease [Thermoanaerobacterales bacterium]
MGVDGQFIQYLFSGLTVGSIYALIALALVVTFNITGIFNLAIGEFVTIGVLTAVSLREAGCPDIMAYALAVIIAGVIGAAMERSTVHRARNASVLTLIIITIGVAIALRGAALLIWGTHPYTLHPFIKAAPISVGGATIVPQSLLVLCLAMVAVGILFAFFDLTYAGKAVRAAMVNPTAARLVGINPERLSLLAFSFSGVIAALAGIFIAPITTATYDMGFMLGLKGFVAAILGGVTNVNGAIVGGLLLGIIEAFAAGTLSSGLKDAVAMAVMILVLLTRPTGILGSTRNGG